jgi:pyrrolidone-carboxylate peptidase
MSRLVLVTGFGSFERFGRNPSGLVAERLAAEPPPGWRVRSAVLPVSFRRAPEALDVLLDELGADVPDLLLGLGVHKQPGYRLELRARSELTRRSRPDVDGVVAADAGTGPGPDLGTGLGGEAEDFARGAPDWRVSRDAGGYVCERTYRRLLEHGERLARPAVFVHVPPEAATPVEGQCADLERFLEHLDRVL